MMCIGVSAPPQKHHPPSFFPSLFLSLQTVQAPQTFLGNSHCNPHEKGHPLFPSNPPLKTDFLSSPPLTSYFVNLVRKFEIFCIMSGSVCF